MNVIVNVFVQRNSKIDFCVGLPYGNDIYHMELSIFSLHEVLQVVDSS